MIVEAIYLSPAGGEPIQSVDVARCLVDLGLEGDRYAIGNGSFSRWPKPGRDVSIIAVEDLDRLHAEHGYDLSAGAHRRNIVVRGGDLKSLVETKFRIGDVLFQGVRPCLPCNYIEKKLKMPGLRDAMYELAQGLRADVLEEGLIRPGDRIVPLES